MARSNDITPEFKQEFDQVVHETTDQILNRRTPKKGNAMKDVEVIHVIDVTGKMARSAAGKTEMEMIEMRDRVNAIRRLYRLHERLDDQPIDLLFSTENYAKWASNPDKYRLSNEVAVPIQTPTREEVVENRNSVFDALGL